MTTKPVVDERFLNHLADTLQTIRKNIKNDIDDLRNKEGDIFARYMAYCRAKATIRSFEFLADMGAFLLKDGHTLNHEYFKTQEYIEAGWNDDHLAKNDFFERTRESFISQIEKIMTKLEEKNKENE